MAENLGMDTRIAAMESATDAGRWYDAFLVAIDRGLHSLRNPFGRAATLPATAVSIPTGTILKWAGAVASIPTGWLECKGQSVSRTTYADLYAAIGTAFGGSGSTFNLPDYRRRVSIGAGGTRPPGSLGPGTGLGDTGGSERLTLTLGQMARHNHDLDLSLESAGAHRHQVGQTWREHSRNEDNTGFRLSGATNVLPSSVTLLDAVLPHRHRITGSVTHAGSASPSPVTITSKSIVMAHIIKT